MNRMGSACSMHRQRDSSFQGHRWGSSRNGGTGLRNSSSSENGSRRSLRHSVVSAVPDGSITNLYPVDDNYVNVGNGIRSPKSLAELATDALCRSLPYLDGELPHGLPRDVVDDVVQSLVQHSALNATTLRVLRNCELGTLSLAGCRGVTDAWLEPLSCSSSRSSGAASPALLSRFPNDLCAVESMDLDQEQASSPHHARDTFYGTFEAKFEEASCSTSSFVTATSNHGSPHHDDCVMRDGSQDFALTATSKESCAPEPVEYSVISDAKRNHTPPPHEPSSVTSCLTLLDLRGSQRLTDRGLMQLKDLGRLETARLDNCHSLVGRGLVAFSSSNRLHTLSLANCRRITDEAMINISHLVSIENLSLDGCRCLTDRSLAAIAELYKLRKLDLSQCDLITDVGLEQLESLPHLEELSLGWCRQVTDHGLEHLSRQHGRDLTLRILRLARCQITDEGVEHLARLVALEELDLNGCVNIGSKVLGDTIERLPYLTTLDVSYCPGILRSSWQGKVRSLKVLELCYSGVRDSHLSKLYNLSTLEELNLDSCPVGDATLAHLADHDVVPNLKALDLADTNLTDQGMLHLPKFTQITRLSLFYCNISNGGLRHLSKLTNLETLNLDSREISDDGLRHLRKLTKLKSLDVFSGRITDTGCAHIAKIKSLESLELCGGGVGDLGCTLLATLENLTSLNLSQNERITNRGAAALAALTNLRALNLSNTHVNAAALCFLGGLKKLQSLALYGCQGMEDGNGLDSLQNGLPNLKCLRLNTASDEDGMVIGDDGNLTDDDMYETDQGAGEDHMGFNHSTRPWAAVAAATADVDDDEDFFSDND